MSYMIRLLKEFLIMFISLVFGMIIVKLYTISILMSITFILGATMPLLLYIRTEEFRTRIAPKLFRKSLENDMPDRKQSLRELVMVIMFLSIGMFVNVPFGVSILMLDAFILGTILSLLLYVRTEEFRTWFASNIWRRKHV